MSTEFGLITLPKLVLLPAHLAEDFYFSDANLRRDRYMKKTLDEGALVCKHANVRGLVGPRFKDQGSHTFSDIASWVVPLSRYPLPTPRC